MGENSFAGHLRGLVLNERNWNDLFVNVISAQPVVRAGQLLNPELSCYTRWPRGHALLKQKQH